MDWTKINDFQNYTGGSQPQSALASTSISVAGSHLKTSFTPITNHKQLKMPQIGKSLNTRNLSNEGRQSSEFGFSKRNDSSLQSNRIAVA